MIRFKKVMYLALSLWVMLMACGCGGAVEYTDSVQAIDISITNKDSVTTRVVAKAEVWKNSGVIVRKGTRYRLAAEGKWRPYVGCYWAGPDGIGVYNAFCWDGCITGKKSVATFSHSALVAKIGEQGKPFVVGDKYEFEAETDGILFFRMNDCEGLFGDNEGNVTVKVTRDKPSKPEPVPSYTQAAPEPEPAAVPAPRKRKKKKPKPKPAPVQEPEPEAPAPSPSKPL